MHVNLINSISLHQKKKFVLFFLGPTPHFISEKQKHETHNLDHWKAVFVAVILSLRVGVQHIQKPRIWETKQLSTDADSSNDTTGGGPRIPEKPKFLKNKNKHLNAKTPKNIYKYAKIHREAWFLGGPKVPKNPNCLKKRKKSSKTQKLKNV